MACCAGPNKVIRPKSPKVGPASPKKYATPQSAAGSPPNSPTSASLERSVSKRTGVVSKGGAVFSQRFQAPSPLSPAIRVAGRTFLPTAAEVPPECASVACGRAASSAKLYKTSYPANDPSEDRSTVVVGDGFVFAGVWDGHGGTPCSEFCESAIWENFQGAVRDPSVTGATVPTLADAFAYSYTKADRDYLAYAGDVPERLFAGSCAVGAYVDLLTQTVTVGNIGDSRAVAGVFERSELPGERHELFCVELSQDQAAADAEEKRRVEALHPGDDKCVENMDDDDEDFPDWRIKKLAAFSRSIGDCQLKDLGAASLYNSKFPIKVLPTPGSAVPDGQAAAEGSGGLVLPYIIPTPETKQASIGGDSFLIVGCDGVWDEMSSEDAVGIVARLLVEHPQADIAALFIEEVLQKAADRCANDYEEEEELTLAELKKRPAGKKTSASRSQLHDDITVVILSFCGEISAARAESFSAAIEEYDLHPRSEVESDDIARQLFDRIDVDGSGGITADQIWLVFGRALRGMIDQTHLDAIMRDMDEDGSGEVSFDGFVRWFDRLHGGRWRTEDQEAGSPRAEESSDRELLTAVPALEALSHRELNQILKHVKVRECKDKEIIIEEGDEGKDMFIIKTGNAVCTKAGLNGGESIREYQPGDFFGERALLVAEPRAATVSASGAVTALVLSSVAYNLVLSNGAAQANLMQYELGQRVCGALVSVLREAKRRDEEARSKKRSGDGVTSQVAHGGQCDVHDAQLIQVVRLLAGKTEAELRAEFDALDADGSGDLDIGEVGTLLRRAAGAADDGLEKVTAACFREMDKDGSGDVDFREFTSFFGVVS